MPTFLEVNRTPALVQNPDFQGIGANQRATARIPVGSTLLATHLRFTIAGTAATDVQVAAQVSRVRVSLDAENKLDVTGAQLLALIRFYRGSAAANAFANGIATVFWHRPWMAEIMNQDAPALGLADVNSATIEVTLAAGATIDGIKAYHETVAGEALGAHCVVLTQNYSFSAAGVQEITDIPRDPLYGLFSVHIQQSPAIIDRVELLADNVVLMEAGTAGEAQSGPNLIHARYAEYDGFRTPQTGWTHIDFTYRNRGGDVLPLLMQDLRLRITWNTAPSGSIVPLVYEQLRIAPVKGGAR